MRSFWYDHEETIVISLMVVASVSIIIAAFVATAADEAKWKQFVIDHNCKIIGKTSESFGFGTGIATNGQAVTTSVYIPGKVGYQCDDGMQYWR